MKKLILSSALIIAVLLSAAAIASDVDGARYRGTIRITNTGESDAANVSVNLTMPTEELLESYMDDIYDAAIRSATGGDTAFMPSVNSTIPWYVFTENVSGSGTLDYIFYCGNVTGGKYRYFPGAAGMTITDNASMELSDNGSVKISGFFNTNVSDIAVYKQGAYTINTGSGNITGIIWDSPTDNLTPTLGASGTWVNPGNACDGNTGTAATCTVTLPAWTPYIYFYTDNATGGIPTESIFYWETDDGYSSINIDIYYGGAWHSFYSGAMGVPGAWVEENDVDEIITAYRMRFYHDLLGGGTHLISLFETMYSVAPFVTDAKPDGEYDVELRLDGTDLKLFIDTIEEDSTALGGASVPDNGNNLTVGCNATTPYIEYFELSVGGVQECYIEWEYDDTTFTDQSGNGNDATPSFPTGSSDADVSASLINFTPVSQAKAEPSSVSYEGELVTDPPDMPSTFYSESSSPGIFFAPVINAFLDAGGVPRSLFWYPFAYFIVLIGGILVYRFTQSLLIQALAMGGLILFFSLPGINVYGMWTVLYYGFEAFAVIILSKHYSW